jgi:hypothetical protein
MAEYRDKSKSSGEDGYKNRRGVDVIADFFGGLTGGARDAMRKRQKKTEEVRKRTKK